MANSRPVLLNNVSSTVQAGSTAIGSASATGINVATGDGTKFGTLNTDEFIPCVIVDTSTSPETVKEYVWVTAIATDTLTVVRQAEESSRYAASTTSIQSGYTIVACHTAVTDDLRDYLRGRYLKPDSLLVEAFPRYHVSTVLAPGGGLIMTAIVLAAGTTISNLAFVSGSTANATAAHWWFALFDNARNQLAVTADQLTASWPVNTLKSLAVATVASGAASSFTTTYSGLYWIGCFQSATTAASLAGGSVSNVTAPKLTPVLCGSSGSLGPVGPQAFPFTATDPNSNAQTVAVWAGVG